MKPAGIERDLQIEVMRNNGVLRKSPPSSWSTDISCAFELWEEMKATGYVELVYESEDKGKITCTYFDTTQLPNREYPHFKGETEADAISGAWIKWKEGQ